MPLPFIVKKRFVSKIDIFQVCGIPYKLGNKNRCRKRTDRSLKSSAVVPQGKRTLKKNQIVFDAPYAVHVTELEGEKKSFQSTDAHSRSATSLRFGLRFVKLWHAMRTVRINSSRGKKRRLY